MQQNEHQTTVLWQELKQGNVEALGTLYDQFIEGLFGYGSQFSHDKQHVMDAIHDLFLNLYKYRKNLANTDNVQFYLYRSLKNQILKSPSFKVVFIPQSDFAEMAETNLSSASIEEQLMETEFLDQRTMQLSSALRCLSKKQKLGIFLRFNEDRQYEEIAEIMNVSVNTSRTIIYRAIKVLRSNLTMPLLIAFFFV